MSKYLYFGRVVLKPIFEFDREAWRRIHSHFRDQEIAYLNGNKPSRMPLWLFRFILKFDTKKTNRKTFGIFNTNSTPEEYIGTIELYNLTRRTATLGIVIGERNYWGKGYGPEAINAILRYAFEVLNLDKVRLNTFADNIRAQNSFKKVGFVEFKRVKNFKGRVSVLMEIHASAWKSLIEKSPAWHLCSQMNQYQQGKAHA